MTKSSKNPLT